jgi:hypothetical protein
MELCTLPWCIWAWTLAVRNQRHLQRVCITSLSIGRDAFLGELNIKSNQDGVVLIN